ncbi:hypothetical protein AB0M02_45725 [Actinoplanes sp. NPDC051861]|uniref:hypothetical protein n=1 Tax=Actinoplanes sp. NPDC051861 TaxID=3155170 RepID=UPI00342FDC0D
MRPLRKSLLSVIVLAAAVVTVTAQPAQAMTYTAAELAAWAYTDSARPTTADPNPDGDAPTGVTGDTGARRAYFTFDLTPYRDQVVHRASFYSSERTVRDCTATAPIEVWRSRPVTETTTWKKAPKELELVGRYNLGKGVICPGAYLGVDVLPQVEAALDRREKSITFEVRVAAGSETDPAVARTWRRFALSMSSNHAPTVSAPKLLYPDRPCGTLAKHPTAGGSFTRFNATAADADGDRPQLYYASWPVAEPEKRVESTSITRDLREFADGTVIAWAAQARDRDDSSPWTRTCYLTVDNTAPAKAPVVFSRKYDSQGYPGTGGPGVPGTFVFDAEGDRDVVGFAYRTISGGATESVAANRPGGRARVEIAPSHDARSRVEVQSYDAAGNRGPWTGYDFWVRDTAPFAVVDVAGVGLPSRITLQSRAAEVTSFGYALNGGAEVRVPVVDGKGTGEIVFPSVGSHTIVERSYAGRKVIGTETETIWVSDAPGIASEQFNWQSSPLSGVPGTFTFTPRTANVVAYRYDFGDEQKTIEAGPDGSAVLEWTPEDGRYYEITVVAVKADGSVTEAAREQFFVISTKPFLYTDYGTTWPDPDGVGRPANVHLDSDLPDVTGFVYSFDGGPEKETTDGAHAIVEVVPLHAGENTFTARARLADGTLSPAATLTFTVSDAPLVSVRGPYGETPMTGREATFTFEPAMPDVTGYRYTIGNSGEETYVAAKADGTAQFVWTPQCCSYEMLVVHSVRADGSVTESRTFGFQIDDAGVSVSATWDQWWPSGGMGVPGRIGFSASPSEATKRYLWHVGDEPVQSVDREEDVLVTYVPYTPRQTGELILYVQREFVDGVLSPVTEYRMLVGTKPLVEADRLQDNSWNGAPGDPAVLKFSGGMPGITEYDYRVFDYTALTEVAAGTVSATEGVAELAWTPAEAHYFIVTVTGRTADGTITDEGQLSFSVFS